MQYAVSAMAIALVLAVIELSKEVGSEYFAKYLADQEISDYGVATSAEGPVTLATLTHTVEDADPTIGHIVPILFSGAAMGAATGTPPAAGFGGFQPIGLQITEAVTTESVAVESVVGESVGGGAAGPSRPVHVDPHDLGWLDPLLVRPRPGAGAEGGADPADPASIIGEASVRRSDGTVFLPISTQRLLSMRSMVTRIDDLPRVREMPGLVTPGAAGSAVVSAGATGIVESADGSFPYVGMPVEQGQLLAYLRPSFSPSERAEIDARMQQLVNDIAMATSQIARLQEVLIVRYRANKIAELEIQIQGHRAELVTLRSALDGRQPLRATMSGVIAAVHTAPSGAVEMGLPVVEIVDPALAWVEAVAADPETLRDVRHAAAVTADGRVLPLAYLGAAPAAGEAGLAARFRILDPLDAPRLGAQVTVLVAGDAVEAGIAVPADAVVEAAGGRRIVWERLGAEIFLPRPVETQPLAGGAVLVTAGLRQGMRIVTSAADMVWTDETAGAIAAGEAAAP